VKWFRKAADAGEVWAQLHLGLAFSKGQGVALDYVQARMWLTLSASSASFEYQEQSAEARDDVAKKLTPQQLGEAQRMAREWRPKK
jgi:TPR repeat protein